MIVFDIKVILKPPEDLEDKQLDEIVEGYYELQSGIREVLEKLPYWDKLEIEW